MKMRFFTTVILLIVVCVVLCGCAFFSAPLSQAEITNRTANKVRIYVCGAVEREGYYEVEVGTDYAEVLRRAGALPQSVTPVLNSSYVDGNLDVIIVDYYDGQTKRVSIDANSVLICARKSVDGLSDEVVNKLADYIDAHGKIANKGQLEQALGRDYANNYYKLHIAEKDYEQTD